MTSDDLKKKVTEWVAKIGPKEAIKRLINADISVHVAQKLVAGSYDREPSFNKAQAILREMAKDGFRLTDDSAS